MNGIAIVGVLPDSPAAKYGLKHGDVLLSVNGVAMHSVEDFLEARALSREKMEVLVRRGAHLMELSFEIGRKKPKTSPTQTLKNLTRQLRLATPPAEQPLN